MLPQPLISEGPPGPAAATVEEEWAREKALEGAITSTAMDELMKMTGLQRVKWEALSLYRQVIQDKERPVEARSVTTLNFIFTGNPGTGKTTGAGG